MLMLLACTGVHAYDFEKDGIYYNVTSLTDLTVEVTEEGSSKYRYQGEVVIPSTVEWNGKEFTVNTIGEQAFSLSDITSVTLPASLTQTGSMAFYRCDNLTSITIPDNVQYIGTNTFSSCSNLSSVTFPKNLEEIDFQAFESCTALTEIILPDNLKRIGNNSFENCTQLSAVTLPGSLLTIEKEVFRGCSNLNSITMKCSIPPNVIESSFPANTYLNGTLYVPQGSAETYKKTPIWNYFSTIIETEYADPTTRLLTVTATGNGYVSFLNQTVSNGSIDWSVEPNSSVDIFAYPEEGYQTTITVHDDQGNSSSISGWTFTTVEIGEEHVTVEVTFEKIPVNLVIQQAESGTVKVEAEYGKARTVHIMPENGWHIHSVTLDGIDYTYALDSENSFTTPELYTDTYLNVAFEQDGDGVSSLSSSPVKVYAQNGRLVVEQVGTGSEIRIYDSAGRTVKTLDAQGGRTETALPTGQVYIVKTVGKTVKIAL